MAPMHRTEASLFGASQGGVIRSTNGRESSWEIAGSQQQSDGSREESEEPASYDGENLEYDDDDSYSQTSPAPLHDQENNDDILHPLREAADRVGREVERYAEVLDEYNPSKAGDNAERHGMTFDLIELYHNIALETVGRLRDQHESERRRQDGAKWRRKMRGFKISQDPEVMDTDDVDENGDFTYDITQTTVQDLERWEEEARTWDLLKRMAKLQYPDTSSRNVASQQSQSINRYSSERQVWEDFLNSDPLALERQTVVRWLQDTAEESGADINELVHELQQNAERGDIVAHGWLHTKAAIKNQKRIHVWPHVLDPSSPDVMKVHLNSAKTEPLITQLDPDAPTRQKRKLEPQDQFFERATWMGCYELLRRGKSAAEIREWCGERTEIWRAVSMSGMVDSDLDGLEYGLEHTSTTLWRRMCFALAKRGGIDEYERAVYGILSGDLSTVEPICHSWDDHLFAHYNALVKSQFEDYLRARHPERTPSDSLLGYKTFDAVQFHGNPKTVGKDLIKSLASFSDAKSDTTRTLKMLQGVLIAKEFGNFIYQQGLALSKVANADTESILIPRLEANVEIKDTNDYIALSDYDSLRVVVHMLLAFKSLGLSLGDILRQTAIENVIVAYIGFLRLAGKEELIPLYASQLTGDRLYATLSRELVDVTDPEQRMTQIKLMKDLGLDVQKFAMFQTEFLIQDFPDELDGYPAEDEFKLLEQHQESGDVSRDIMPVKAGFIGVEVNRIDLLLIRSLEWHLLVDGLWAETFATGVLLYKRFFRHAKLAATKELMRSVPSSHISLSKTRPLLGESLDLSDLEEGEDEYITERIDESAAHTRLMKRHLLAEAKSFRELERLTEALNDIQLTGDCIAAIRSLGAMKLSKENRIELYKALESTKQSVNCLLQGWLLESQKEDVEFKLLREAYLPEIVLAYDSLLHFSGMSLSRDNFLECMELAAIVAAEGSDLADMFVKNGRMPELVRALAQNSRALLAGNSPGKPSKTGASSKTLRSLGWTRDVWDIKL